MSLLSDRALTTLNTAANRRNAAALDNRANARTVNLNALALVELVHALRLGFLLLRFRYPQKHKHECERIDLGVMKGSVFGYRRVGNGELHDSRNSPVDQTQFDNT